MKIQKTNAMRILDSAHLSYEVLSYTHGKEAVAGLDVAAQPVSYTHLTLPTT